MTKKHPVKSHFFVANSDVSLALGHPGARRGSYSPEVMPQATSTGLAGAAYRETHEHFLEQT